MTISVASGVVRARHCFDVAPLQILLNEHRQARLDQIKACTFANDAGEDQDPVTRRRALTLAKATLEEIDRALARLRDGSYGMCVGCTEDIPAERLSTVPWTAYCVTCASSR
jgi:DnaK suppressor protein